MSILRAYLALAKLIKLPFLGKLVGLVASSYGKNFHQGYLLTTEEANKIIDTAKTIALGPCSCRKISHNCKAPLMAELVVGFGADVFTEERSNEFRSVQKEEAKEIMKQCHEMNLIPTFQKCKDDFYAICNCCTCCCIPLRLSKNYNVHTALVRDSKIIDDFIQHQIEHKYFEMNK
jgi:hypothetical protein